MALRAMETVALGLLLGATVFSVLALNVAWAAADVGEGDLGYGALTLRQTFGSDSMRVSYDSEGLDDADGIGLVRAGGVLLFIGTLLIGLAALAAEHRLWLDQDWLASAAAVAGALAALVLTTGVVLLPIGIAGLSKDAALGLDGVDTTWVFGLYAGIVAGVLAWAGAALAAVAALRATGFRLQAAETGTADFD